MITAFDRYEREQWAGRAADFERSYAQLCAYPAGHLLDAAGVGGGVRVLDVGTGTGTVARAALGRGAVVVAVDAERSMVDAARGKGVDARVAVLPSLPFGDGEFDAVVANFVVNHVGAPGAAVRELRRVVRDGGRVAVSVWPSPRPPLQALWDDVFAAAGVVAVRAAPVVDDGENFARTADGLAGLLARAGLEDVRGEEVRWEHRADPEDWWSGPAGGLGSLGSLMRGQSDEVVRRIREEYDRAIDRYRTGDGLFAAPTAALVAAGVRRR